jgi:type II secretory pathway predicted ATPase ExeA
LFGSKGQGVAGTRSTVTADPGERGPDAADSCSYDPFGETANAAEYVPRDATEAVLRDLVRLVSQPRPVALISPPGLGKTLLMHVLARRLGPKLRCLYLPYGAMPLEELCAWALGRIEEPVDEDPVEALLERARTAQRQASAVVLLIDDASSLPPDTAEELGAHIRDTRGALRLVLATPDDAVSTRIIASVGPEVAEVRLSTPMSRRETHLYIDSRLERAGAPVALRSRFNTEAVDRIHDLSGGIPRHVNELAASLATALPEGVRPSWRDQRWIGTPLDELSGQAEDAADIGEEEIEVDELLEARNLLLRKDAR